MCFADILAFLKESVCPRLSKLLACQTRLGKYDCKYKSEVQTQGLFQLLIISYSQRSG